MGAMQKQDRTECLQPTFAKRISLATDSRLAQVRVLESQILVINVIGPVAVAL